MCSRIFIWSVKREWRKIKRFIDLSLSALGGSPLWDMSSLMKWPNRLVMSLNMIWREHQSRRRESAVSFSGELASPCDSRDRCDRRGQPRSHCSVNSQNSPSGSNRQSTRTGILPGRDVRQSIDPNHLCVSQIVAFRQLVWKKTKSITGCHAEYT